MRCAVPCALIANFSANSQHGNAPSGLHLIRPCGAPSPPGEGFSGCAANLKLLAKPGFGDRKGKRWRCFCRWFFQHSHRICRGKELYLRSKCSRYIELAPLDFQRSQSSNRLYCRSEPHMDDLTISCNFPGSTCSQMISSTSDRWHRLFR